MLKLLILDLSLVYICVYTYACQSWKMGKNKQGKRSLQKKDVFQRLNYLYQAAHFVVSMSPPNTPLVKHYMNTMVTLALKNVVRLSPHIKRTICKGCKMLLVPGITCCVRHRGKGKSKRSVWTCMECGTLKKFLLVRNYELWHDKPENILEITPIDTHSKLAHSNSSKKSKGHQSHGLKFAERSLNQQDVKETSDTADPAVRETVEYLLTETISVLDNNSKSVNLLNTMFKGCLSHELKFSKHSLNQRDVKERSDAVESAVRETVEYLLTKTISAL